MQIEFSQHDSEDPMRTWIDQNGVERYVSPGFAKPPQNPEHVSVQIKWGFTSREAEVAPTDIETAVKAMLVDARWENLDGAPKVKRASVSVALHSGEATASITMPVRALPTEARCIADYMEIPE